MADLAKMKVLVVDDFSTMRRIVISLLKEMGFEDIEEAKDGKEALDRVLQGGIEFVVSDINMPNMNGFEFLEGVRKNPASADLPVLMVTAEARKEDIVRAAQLKASGYVVKPFTKAILEEKLSKVLERMKTA